MGLEARIWALRLGFVPQEKDLCLETRIWASRGGGAEKKEKEKRKEKFPLRVKAEVIGCCPKANVQ